MKLVDTSVVIDIDRGGVEERVTKLDEEGRHAMSVVTLTELRLGVNLQYERGSDKRAESIEALERLCARFDLIEVSRNVSLAAADIIAAYRDGGKPLDDLHDVYIAATARTEQLPVLTANVAHFERIPDLNVIDWAEY